jgi:hypothetical protein
VRQHTFVVPPLGNFEARMGYIEKLSQKRKNNNKKSKRNIANKRK